MLKLGGGKVGKRCFAQAICFAAMPISKHSGNPKHDTPNKLL